MEFINNIDAFFIDMAMNLRCTFLNYFLGAFTYFGNSGIGWIILGLVLLSFRRTRKMGFAVLICLLFTWLLSNVTLKAIIARPRPFVTFENLYTVIPPLSDFSCPSGHASSSFTAATAIFLYNKRAGIPAFITAFLVSLSRIYFTVHYFSDVLLGSMIGILMAIIIVKVIFPAFGKIYRKKLYRSTKTRCIADGFCLSPIPDDVFARINGISYKENDDIKRNMLHYLTVKYIGFDGLPHDGEMIANRLISGQLLRIFKKLYDRGYKIEKMHLIDEYGADDDKSMTDNNSSAFCYRTIANQNTLSNHALGLAVDINPLYNPYIQNGKVLPEASRPYADRKKDFPHKLDKKDPAVRLFKSYGFKWGGDWKSGSLDWQHFDKKLHL